MNGSERRPRRLDWAGWLALLAALVVVGLLRLAVPQFLPTEVRHRPDADGWAHIPHADGKVLGDGRTLALKLPGGEEITTPGEFVVLNVRLDAHKEVTQWSPPELHTPDGRVYRQPGSAREAALSSTNPGFSYLVSLVFEVPAGEWRGGVVLLSAMPVDGVQPLADALAFPVRDGLPDYPGIEVHGPEQGVS